METTPDLPALPADVWAAIAIAAMLVRVKSVCITEYQWMIEELME